MKKTYINKKSGATTTLLSDGEFDAVNVITKRLGIRAFFSDSVPKAYTGQLIKALSLTQAKMPSTNKGVVKTRQGDEFDARVGTRLSLEKAQQNYRKSFTKSMRRWQYSIMKKIYEVNPSTFSDAMKDVQEYIENNK